MKACTVKHRSSATREKCPICGKKSSKAKNNADSLPDVSSVDRKVAKAQKLFNDGWRNIYAEKLQNSLRCTTASKSTREPDDTDYDFADWQYRVGGSVINTPDDELDDSPHTDDVRMYRRMVEERTEKIDGYVTRGVKTPVFDSADELDEYVQDMVESGNFSFASMDGIRGDSFAPFTRRPAMAGMFAKGLTRMWENQITLGNVVRERKRDGASGYIIRAEDADGYDVSFEDSDFCESAEAEVLVRSDKLEAVDFIPSRESGYGMPVVVVKGQR